MKLLKRLGKGAGTALTLFTMTLMCAQSLAHSAHVTPKDQARLDLTVYADFALVRDVREFSLPVGAVELEFEHVARTIDPTSVRVRTLNDVGVTVLRQSYQYDLLNKHSLLERYIGRKLKYSRTVQLDDNTFEKVLREGILLSIEPEIVQFGDEIEISPEGVISLPYVPEGLKTIPTLVWRLDNKRRGIQQVETTYIADQLGWEAEYTLSLSADESTLSLSSWVNLTNETGVTWTSAGLKLVAGNVNRERQSGPRPQAMMARAEFSDAAAPPSRSMLGDYHIYEFPGRVDLANHEVAQLRFLEANGIPVEKRYISRWQVARHQMNEAQVSGFDISYAFDTTRVDEPLPAGRARIMKADVEGRLQLLGEDRIDHTPVGKKVEVTVGQAFDLVAERTQMSYRQIDRRAVEMTVDVRVSNHGDERRDLTLHEKLFGDWEVVSRSGAFDKIDATTLALDVALEAGAERVFSYTIRTRW